MRALIVEDDIPLGFMWGETLEEAGFDCCVCSCVEEAQRESLAHRFDLVVLDLFVRNGNTLTLSDCIGMRNPGTPILMITGSSVFTRGEHAQVAPNVTWLMQKPVRPEDLTAMASYLVRGKAEEEPPRRGVTRLFN